MSTVLEVSGLNKDYALTQKKPEPDAFAVRDVTFSVPKGFIMGFVGPNGAGKTTVIKLLMQIKRMDTGRVSLFGSEAMQNNDIGVVMDLPHFPADWKLTQIEKALAPFYSQWDSNNYYENLKKFELNPKKKVKELSRGMQVKLQIAIALSHNAKLLVLDEPTSGLDPVARDEVCELLQDFVVDSERSVLFSTHITSDLEKIADYVTMILRGRIAFTGTKDALLERYLRVTGGVNELTDESSRAIIGLRKHRTGFEGIIASENQHLLPSGVLTEKPSLDEIIIFLNRGSKNEQE